MIYIIGLLICFVLGYLGGCITFDCFWKGRTDYWYAQAMKYKQLWLLASFQPDDSPDDDDDTAIDTIPYEEEKEPEIVKAIAKGAGAGK